jgi:threonine dehydrogenase-like Zn-dependent dehydrogenase
MPTKAELDRQITSELSDVDSSINAAERIIAVDMREEKLARARTFGATDGIDASQSDAVKAVRELTAGRGVDYAFEVIGRKETIERALAASGRLGGHFVQGHIDCTARALSFAARGTDYRLEMELPADFAHYAAFKGSVALNGVSLTIAELLQTSFVVWIIPHTRRQTNFETLQPGDIVNLEFDLIAKYVERMLPRMIVEQE